MFLVSDSFTISFDAEEFIKMKSLSKYKEVFIFPSKMSQINFGTNGTAREMTW